MDSRASRHVTFDLRKLSIHSNYDGTADMVKYDGTGLKITHSDSTTKSEKLYTFRHVVFDEIIFSGLTVFHESNTNPSFFVLELVAPSSTHTGLFKQNSQLSSHATDNISCANLVSCDFVFAGTDSEANNAVIDDLVVPYFLATQPTT